MLIKFIIVIVIIVAGVAVVYSFSGKSHAPGTPLDSFNGVTVYYNGKIADSHGRNLTADGYNLGQKYQCVEYIKRYYYEVFNHKMPNTYGHAKDFFQLGLKDGAFNKDRALTQYTNPSKSKPQIHDIVVMDGYYGHVAIVTEVTENSIEVIQQNVGTNTRATITLTKTEDDLWKLKSSRVTGWLRKSE